MKLYNEHREVIGELYNTPHIELNKNATTISSNGIELIKEFEGFRANPYLCPAGIPTIGYGTTRYSDGTKVTLNDKPISKAEATRLLSEQVSIDYGAAVDTYTPNMTTQNQFDAMTSFAYNVGVGAFKSSTLLRKHNKGNFKGAAKEFDKWIHANGKVMQGLVDRRAKEKELYLKG